MDEAAPLSRRWLARGAVLALVLALLAPAAVSAATYDRTDFRTGTIERAANGTTVISIQGFHYQGYGSLKKPAGLIGVGPRGHLSWRLNGTRYGAEWYYDVDPLPNGHLLVVRTNGTDTLVFEYDPDTGERVWRERFPIEDTHDVDLLSDGTLLVANMRAYNATADRNDERIFIYDRERDEVVWEWYFRDHFPREGGWAYDGDWTHVNDVDEIAPGRYLVSVRNFDQVIVVDRSSGEIVNRLGADNAHQVLHEQHNPTYLEAEDGTPTILVADSESDRIVEYEFRGRTWVRTWSLSGGFNWPRDADRLPNGNTLVVDSLNNRVVEVTPRGRIVWEVYAPWGPYDAERVEYGDEAGGPTMRDLGVTGHYELSNSAGLEPGTGTRVSFDQWLAARTVDTPLEGPAGRLAARWAHVTPWIAPVWMTGWDAVGVLTALLIGLVWTGGEVVYRRRVDRSP